MKNIKLKKISGEHNTLGFDSIEIIETQLMRERVVKPEGCGCKEASSVTVYDYIYLAICDGKINQIFEDDLWHSAECYEVVV